MKKVLHIVDSRDYVSNNCFQHQLMFALKNLPNHEIHTVPYDELGSLSKATGSFDSVISCMKQRTLFRHAEYLKEYVGSTPIVVYDQDPWESFKDGSPYKGAYHHIAKHLNVKTFAVTTKWWADYVVTTGLPSTFVSMWVLPTYCDSGSFDTRKIELGFLGTIHPHRKVLFDELQKYKLNVSVRSSSLPYADYLRELSDIKVFLHSEDSKFSVENVSTNMNVGLWVKDIEAAARGCFSIRNRAEGWETYTENISTIWFYDKPSEVLDIIEHIRKIDPVERQHLINHSVEYIRAANKWQETAKLLVI